MLPLSGLALTHNSMAILAIFYGQGFTKDMYEKLRGEVQWEKKLADGAVFHAAGFDAAGDIHVADVWQSQEAMDSFVGSRLAPAFQKLNIPMPKVEVYPAHNINVHPNAEQYKLAE